jgi:hypothetical protein
LEIVARIKRSVKKYSAAREELTGQILKNYYKVRLRVVL